MKDYINPKLCSSFKAPDSLAVSLQCDLGTVHIVCVYRSQALTSTQNRQMVNALKKLSVDYPDDEIIIVGDSLKLFLPLQYVKLILIAVKRVSMKLKVLNHSTNPKLKVKVKEVALDYILMKNILVSGFLICAYAPQALRPYS